MNIVRKLLAPVAAAAVVLFAFAAVASAHVPSATLTCVGGNPTLSISLTQYSAGVTNTVKYSIDGTVVLNTFSFGTTYTKSQSAGDPFVRSHRPGHRERWGRPHRVQRLDHHL